MKSIKLLLEQIEPGFICGSNICDPDGKVLIGKGVEVTESFLEGLDDRGITDLYVSESDWEAITGGAARPKKKKSEPDATARPSRRVVRTQEAYSYERMTRFSRKIDDSLDLIEGIGASIHELTPKRLNLLRELPRDFAEMLIEDGDQSLAASSRAINDTLASRCAQFSMLAISTGIEMDLQDDDISLLGSACLFHDFGLFLLPEKFRNPTSIFDEDEANEYRHHPETTYRFLSDFPAVSDEMRVLAMQVHELPDGSGYPRGIMKNRYHRLTRIVNLIEMYLALTQATPKRAPLVPHDALVFMLVQCTKGLLDPDVMRAFMNLQTLFGIDCPVRLSSGDEATVVRRDADHYDKPVVLVEGDDEDNFTRLSTSDLSISAPVAVKQQMRIDMEAAKQLRLDAMFFL